MQIKILFLFLLSFYLISSTAEATAPALKMNLTQSIQKSLELSPILQTAKNQLEVAELEAKNALALFFPSLDLSASHGVRSLEPDTAGVTAKTNSVSGTTLSLTENFYDNGESSKRKKMADQKYELAKLNFQKVKAQIIRSVALAYYRFNINRQILGFTEKSFQELERQEKLVSNQFYQGLKTRKDFLRFKTQAQRARLSVISTEQAVINAKSQLMALIGVSPTDNIVFDENVKPVLPQKILVADVDPKFLYEYRYLYLQRKVGELEVDLARRKYWPEFNLIGAASYGSSDYINTGQSWNDNDLSQWSVLLNLKFNLIDWGTRSRNIRIASYNQNTVEQGLREQLLSSERELQVFNFQVQESEENYRLSKELQKLEEDTYKILERDYRSGQATYLELATGITNLLDAQARGLEADYNQADLYLKWKYYKGTLSEETVFQ